MAAQSESEWIDEEQGEDEFEYPEEYNISSSPNDFNVIVFFDFVSSDIVKIPGFQRNYVWGIKKASKLIEPAHNRASCSQLFFYEKERNDFLVIDGQQRLMTVYYFLRKNEPS